LFLAFAIGKWTGQTCSEMIGGFKRSLRSPGREEKVEVFTDGNDDYTYAFPCFFKVKQLNYGQLVKIRDANGRLVRKEIRVVYGDPDRDYVETVNMWKRLTLKISTVSCGNEWAGWLERQNASLKRSSVFVAPWFFSSFTGISSLR